MNLGGYSIRGPAQGCDAGPDVRLNRAGSAMVASAPLFQTRLE